MTEKEKVKFRSTVLSLKQQTYRENYSIPPRLSYTLQHTHTNTQEDESEREGGRERDWQKDETDKSKTDR